MDLSRILADPPRITCFQEQRDAARKIPHTDDELRDSARKIQKLPDLIPHLDDLYWHPMALPLPASSHPLPTTRIYFPLRRLHAKLATAADLPVDLFDLILSFVEVHIHERNSTSMVGFNKRNLGRVTLVCRRWANICQPKIFETITLRSRQDFFNLWSFIVLPGSMGPRLIQYLHLEPANFDAPAPWIHLVCQKIFPRMLHPDVKVSLCLVGKEDTPLKLGKSIHASLPRQLPVFSSGIRKIELYLVHFRRLEDLARLIGEMPSLREVDCNHVTWPPLPDGQPHLTSFITRRLQLSVSYEMKYCTDNTAAVLLSLQTVPVGQPRLCIDDVCAMSRILRALSPPGNSDTAWSEYVFESDTGSGVMTVDLEDYGKLVFITPDAFPQRIASIDVRMDFGPEDLKVFSDTEAWKEVDNCLRALLRVNSQPNTLEWIRFSLSYPQMTKKFADEIVGPHMPYLSSVDKARYGVLSWDSEHKEVVRPVTLEEIRDRKQRNLIYEELGLHIWDWEQVESDKPDSEDTVSDDEDFGEGSEGYHEPGSEGIKVDPEDNA